MVLLQLNNEVTSMSGKKTWLQKLKVLFDFLQILLQKVAQLEEAWKQKDKFIHSSRMIVRFREEHISRLEAKLKAGQNLVSNDNNNESQALMEQLKDENKILRDQVFKTAF